MKSQPVNGPGASYLVGTGMSDMPAWDYELWPSQHPYDWSPGERGHRPDDQLDFHVDLGAGVLRKGRITVDRHGPVDVTADLEQAVLPFPDDSIESMISHHCLEHIGPGFMRLMDECYRVLRHGAPFRIIVPLFPSTTAVEDQDHKRYFMANSFMSFEGVPGETHWHESFAVPYTRARFKITDKDVSPPTPPERMWTETDAREMRTTLKAVKHG